MRIAQPEHFRTKQLLELSCSYRIHLQTKLRFSDQFLGIIAAPTSAMICSVSTDKSSSSWLDRLRSNKGFPTGDDLDLDHFLRNNKDDNPNPNPESNSSESTQSESKRVAVNRKATTETCGGNGDDKEEWLGLMNNVLSDLFNMGDPTGNYRFSGKKSSRKQRKPKLCLVSRACKSNAEEQSSGCVRQDENAHEMKEEEEEEEEEENVNHFDCGDIEEEEEEDGERSERELFGYSRNEVTVIDTSFAEWKVEKLVYRRRNVWKVREKKGKTRTVGRKKRKANEIDGNADGKKKAKVFNGGGGDCAFASKHGDSPGRDKGEDVGKETSDDLGQVPKKRFLLPRLPKKTKRGSSSVILVKGMPTSKQRGAKFPKSRTTELGTEKRQAVCNKALSTTFPMAKGFRD